ncbi:MAG: SUMF1/EgtB/PvdO family nonheme iron enzyme [Dysgonamonadaceae bacterium]|nr:SUMF1/EgtB/PvdO family nonheme iron enzyme [Dysgonamonadaceae bacterium]
MKRTIKSFTLIELLVVIVIIGILAGVIIVSTSSSINSAKNAKMVAELSNLSKSFEGYSHYYVGSLCIEDTVNNPNFLSYYGLTTVPKHDGYIAGQTALTTNNCYLYFSDGKEYSIRTPSVGNKGYLIQESRTQKTQNLQTSCDAGWIPFGNRCIMQYEAKCSNGGGNTATDGGYPWSSCTETVVSASAGEPITNITQIQAKAACESIGAHLITNAEWMSLARDIEQVKENWTGGALGSGVLKRGNVGDSLAGDYDGANPEVGVTNDLAKLKLSNGKEIYHLSGNVYEWVDDKISCGTTTCPNTLMPYDSTPASEWIEYANVSTWGKYSKAELSPLTYFTGSLGVGRLYTDNNASAGPSDTYTHAFLRSLSWGSTSYAGVFALYLNSSPADSNSSIGFRCAR